ncbi:MAG: hypothetical protein JO165_13535 [Candidatus Eremiobacteraeota bacterium]|nr:hypothetical protein [Candidatus Eremiobacteraeota bacterium]
MRYFVSTGEASGELTATLLAAEIRRLDPSARFEGIGGSRMRDAGFSLWRNHTGWATLGLFHAIPRIPKMLVIGLHTAWHIVRTQPDVVIVVDFGGFHMRLARVLRILRYRKPVLDLFPPGAWFDQDKRARAVARDMTPVTAFTHQRDFYRSLGLPVHYFGHPLAARYTARAPRTAPSRDGGTIALLPGSRAQELRYHLPALCGALLHLRTKRPNIRAVFAAADAAARDAIAKALRDCELEGCSEIADGALAALQDADAAWVASGTAVLEAVLCGVPTIGFYIVNPRLARYARHIYRRKWYTLPNLVLDREVVREIMQEAATPEKLADAMDEMLSDPQPSYMQYAAVREALGSPDALAHVAALAVTLAKEARS